MNITRDFIAASVAARTGVSKTMAKEVIIETFQAIENYLISDPDNRVVIAGFGSFGIKQTKPRLMHNISTGEKFMSKPRNKAFYNPGAEFRRKIEAVRINDKRFDDYDEDEE